MRLHSHLTLSLQMTGFDSIYFSFLSSAGQQFQGKPHIMEELMIYGCILEEKKENSLQTTVFIHLPCSLFKNWQNCLSNCSSKTVHIGLAWVILSMLTVIYIRIFCNYLENFLILPLNKKQKKGQKNSCEIKVWLNTAEQIQSDSMSAKEERHGDDYKMCISSKRIA